MVEILAPKLAPDWYLRIITFESKISQLRFIQ